MTDCNAAIERLRASDPVPSVELLDPDELSSVVALCEERRLTPISSAEDDAFATTPRRYRRPALAFAAAFAFVVALVGAAALVNRDGAPVVDEPAPASTTVLPATTTPQIPPTTTPRTVIIEDPVGIYDTGVGHDGSLWAATGAGVVRWAPDLDELLVYTSEDGLPRDAAFELVVAPDGTVWVGGHGWMARFDEGEQPQWVGFTGADSSGPMAVSTDGSVWTVAGVDRLLRFDGSDWETIVVEAVCCDVGEWSNSLAIAPDGTVWAGTNERRGAISYDGSTITHHRPATGLPEGFGSSVAIAPDGTVWIGSEAFGNSESGVASFDGSEWTVYTTDDGLLANSADVAVGADGTVWAIHPGPDDNGVSSFDGEQWTAHGSVTGAGRYATVDGGGTLWMPSGDTHVVGFDGATVVHRDLPELATMTRRAVAPPIGTWNPILEATVAQAAPQSVACPSGTDPNLAGPGGQGRPHTGHFSNQAAVFDTAWNRVVMIDSYGETWTFDVCTNTWHEMRAAGVPEPWGSLVYDADSDRTVLFGEDRVWVYDRDLNEWEQQSNVVSDGFAFAGLQAFYDPMSGLIVTTGGTSPYQALSAYDVETDTWTQVGTVDLADWMMVGYSPSLDRIIGVQYAGGAPPNRTVLLDPRTGAFTDPGISAPDLVGGFGSVVLANGTVTAAGLAWPTDADGLSVCLFGPTAPEWICVPNEAADTVDMRPFDAITYDSTNQRLVLIGGQVVPWGPGEINRFDDVWSLDLDTGEWLELLTPSS